MTGPRRMGIALILALMAALLGVVTASPVGATEVGPDTFGYEASDSNGSGGPLFTSVDISATGTDIGLSGDDVDVGPIALDTPFSFYGVDYSDIRVGSNGIIGFGATNLAGDLSNDCPNPAIPSTGHGARIYPLHDDLVTGSAYMQRFETSPVPNYYTPGTNEPAGGAPVIQFSDVRHFGNASLWDM